MRTLHYFKGLDILRFLAAALVILAHSHYHLNELGISWHNNWKIMYQGRTAVLFFFTLSGFLLTSLAIQEQGRNGSFNTRKFYYRRLLRIWPLYYGIVLLSCLFVFILLPVFYPAFDIRFPMPVSLLCMVFFVPNYLRANGITNFGAINGLWSIGVEEMFYLLFPLLILLHKKIKNYILIFTAALVLFLILYTGLYYSRGLFPITLFRFLLGYLFHYMLVGGMVAAAWMHYRDKQESLRRFNVVVLLAGALAVGLLLGGVKTVFWQNALLIAFLFAALIVFTAQADSRFFNRNPLVYFGKISYGIYLFHPFVSYLFRLLCARSAGFLQLIRSAPVLYFLLLLGLTIVVAHLSYRFYERRFLQLKNRVAAT
jgi:peptidoglycan/LPS O-acetylase OafA/YrhL